MRQIERVVAAALAGVVVSGASAQDAVQWRVEDGGNGHWYQAVDAPGIQWPTASAASGSRGAHLATATSLDENRFLADIAVTEVTGPGWWIGGLYDYKASAWTWVTGEAWKFSSWGQTALGCNDQPDGRDATNIYCLDNQGNPQWSDDFLEWPNALGYIIEWSADCNGDGIVDYGQILDGTFADADGNGVPDCCDDATCLAPVQWRVEDGGNGHWYQAIAPMDQQCWTAHHNEAESLGGYLATITTAEEQTLVADYVRPLYPTMGGSTIGGYQDMNDPEYSEPGGAWKWVTGEAFEYTNWQPGEPGCCGPWEKQNWLDFNPDNSQWRDRYDCVTDSDNNFMIVEWSADCNGDSIVDYGQILDGTFADADGNGVPDLCESCIGDLNGDGVVGPPDLGILLAVWGTDGTPNGADINGDGTVNASDLGPLLGAWGACP
ncbi:MAG: hypothetical protein GY894_00950 [Planctomycetes bacterium]|nr:hypothetical protein [Planctomycetota bacterium]